MSNFSPITKSVDDAFWRAITNEPDIYTKGRVRLAAALRATADHIDHRWSVFNCVDSLYEIAAELEGGQTTTTGQED